ncbi:uncharacterized protein LOC110460686 [Mizuhopecten yessoensis]|uniref:uncharacterized protein LOC110460686 n=1 Tax=Mizuhopecten yessoensis TaxID=6573 RepID=UPI000B459B11|nr:uncharacterized protein LOC110460686 [Mizuhopecten yessoensis]
MKFKTVREGQQAVVFNHFGEGRLIIGPERVFLYRERLQYLKSYTANQYEFLVLKDKDGVVIHKRGPCEIFHNPMMYDSIVTKDATKIDANHLIVVYKRLKDNDVQRRIIQGPTVFVPEAEEWLHQFSWHGCDASDKTRMIPGHNKFTQLAVIPEQFYYNVRDVRTVDDTMITVKLMLFYDLKEILKMLDTTHDPIADMINAVCADVITFSGRNTGAESERERHPWIPRMNHTRSILIKGQQEMEKAEQDHKQEVENMKQVHELEMRQMEHEQALKVATMTTSSNLDDQKAKNTKQVDHLSKLRDLGMDVTLYITLQHTPPANEEIRVATTPAGTAL